MISPGALLPKNAIQDIRPLETPPPTGLGTDFAASAELGFRHNLLGDEILRGRKLLDPAHAEQINEEAAKREGYLNDELSNMKSGIVPTSVSFLGNILGFAADPNNLLAEFGVAELMGPGRAVIARALANSTRGTQVAAETALGAVQQGAAFTPAALADYDVSQQLGQNPTALGVMANIGIAAALGGTIHGIIKARSPITTEAHDTALQTATAQTLNGQRVDVGSILKQGYNDARVNERQVQARTDDYLNRFNADRKAADDAKIADELKGLKDKNDIDVKDAQEGFDKAVAEQAGRRRNRGVLEQEEKPVPDSELIDKALEIKGREPATRTLDDNLFLKGLPKNEEFQQALTTAAKPGFERTAPEKIFMDAMGNGEEPLMIKDRLEQQQKQIAGLQKQLEEKPSSKQVEKINTQLSDLTERVKQGEDRLNQLAGHGDDEAPVQEARKKLEAAQAEGKRLSDLAEAHDLDFKMQQTPELPVTPEDVTASAEKAQTWQNDSALDPDDIAAFDRQAESVPDANESILADTEALINDLKEQGALTEEDERILGELKEYEESNNRFKAALQALKDCFTGGGE